MTFSEAQKAIYIDFECSAKEIKRPAILGVLRPNRTVTHYVIDPDLADAARAHPDCQAATLSDVLTQLADECRKDETRLVSWSRFEMAVIRAASRVENAAAVLGKAHVNALDVVPKWAATYGAKTEKKKFEARNQLHQFFPIGGYRPDWRYGRAAPASWIRHVRAQMAARDGRYHVNRETRRDWHLLLTYNRHDCLGMRHLVSRATAETEKRRAYLDATYTVRHAGQVVRFKIGARMVALDALVARHDAMRWAHITAWNPGLATLSATENRRRLKALDHVVRERGYTTLPGDGQDDKKQWPAEESLFVIGMAQEEARGLARDFGQWAIVTGQRDQAARLVWCLNQGADPLAVGPTNAPL
ncbi:MAG: DUF3293 domain-containing protein [Acidobacteria bacterium]|nr:DUF3293 domain-containing protein [Acidobacteriota bacterium]